jgi:hypothetical protein
VTSITFSLFGFQVEERACSPCGWNVLIVDGAVTTMDELLARANAIDHAARTSA